MQVGTLGRKASKEKCHTCLLRFSRNIDSVAAVAIAESEPNIGQILLPGCIRGPILRAYRWGAHSRMGALGHTVRATPAIC
jgi:hypothetical protein